MIGVCTDSGSRLPSAVADQLGVQVVPLTITLGDQEFLEGIDLSGDDVGRLIEQGHREFAVSQPSPGQFAVAYDELVSRGCDEVLSVLSSRSDANSLGAARLAAHSCDVPVRLVDCASAGLGAAFGFGVGCCAWAAATAALDGATLDGVVAEIEGAAARLRHVCVAAPFSDGAGAPQFRLHSSGSGEPEPLVVTPTLAEAAEAIANHLFDGGPLRRVGIGGAGSGAQPIEAAAAAAILARDATVEVIRYPIGVAAWALRRLPMVGCFAVPYA